MKRCSEEIHRLLDARDAKKPAFEHDCKACVFLGHYYDHKAIDTLEFYDLYICVNEPTVIARFGNEGPQYSSGNNAGFFAHIPALALAAELAIRYLAGKVKEAR